MNDQGMSPRARRARAMFGLTGPDRPPDGAAAEAIDRTLHPGELALVVGPSGAGKSTILRELARRLESRGGRIVRVDPAAPLPDAAVVDLFAMPLSGALSLLARAGLAEAALLSRRPHQLSTGQRFRLALALAMQEAGRRTATLIVDELGSSLDPATAAAIARMLRRWTTGSPVRTVCATTHDDLLEPLGPDLLVLQPLGGPASVHRKRLGGAA